MQYSYATGLKLLVIKKYNIYFVRDSDPQDEWTFTLVTAMQSMGRKPRDTPDLGRSESFSILTSGHRPHQGAITLS